MFGTLPDLTPRDSHSLWYSSSRSPVQPLSALDTHGSDPNNNNGSHHPRQRAQLLERTALHRLAMDEFWGARRKMNVANFGSNWIKPPGIPKTLHQMREEKREQEEHQEAMRREQLAQELAEAEAEGLPEDGEMDDVQLDGAQDLDDDIPDADNDFLPDDDDDGDSEDEEDEEDEDEADANSAVDEDAIREERQNDLMAARMRMTDDAFREALVRGDPDGDDMYGADEELQEEDQGHMLDEDDFANDGMDDGMGVDMDANLDDDIPEAEDGGYEHTDSEADLSSSEEASSSNDDHDQDDDADQDIGFAPRAAPLGPPQSPTLRGRNSLTASRHSMEFSSFLSQDESSFMNSSPAQGRRARHG